MPGKPAVLATALVVMLLAVAPLLATAQPQARAWLVVEDQGNGTIAPSLYIAGLAPPGAIAVEASIEATNNTATLIARAQSPMMASLLVQRGVKSLALTIEASKPAGTAVASARGRLDAVIESGNISIGLIQAWLSRSGEETTLKIELSDIEGGMTPDSIASTLRGLLTALPIGSNATVRQDNGTVVVELALPRGVAHLLGEGLEWNATLILVTGQNTASLSANASIRGDLASLLALLAPRGEGYKPATPVRAAVETLDNGTLLVRLPNMALESTSPESAAASIASYASELLGGNVSYTVRSVTAETGQGTGTPPPASPQPSVRPTTTTTGEGEDTALVAISGVIVAVVLLLLLARARR